MEREELTISIEKRKAEELENALEAMRRGQSPAMYSADQEFQTALHFHVQTSQSDIDDDFREELEHIVMKRFTNVHISDLPQRRHAWFFPSACVGALAVAVVVVITIQPWETTPGRQLATLIRGNDSVNVATTIPSSNTSFANSKNTSNPTVLHAPETSTQTNEALRTLSSSSQVELAGVRTNVEEVGTLQKELEQSMKDMDDLLNDLQAFDTNTDFGSTLTDLQSL